MVLCRPRDYHALFKLVWYAPVFTAVGVRESVRACVSVTPSAGNTPDGSERGLQELSLARQVGLPNVGKSSIFNAFAEATGATARVGNFPFCTIDPNHAKVALLDPRLDQLAKLASSERVVPTYVEVVDIAGLVKGASEGAGLGNRFLQNIRETHAIVHVVRCFDDHEITHVDGSVDPVRDIEVINTELILADLEVIDRRLQRARKKLSAVHGEAELTGLATLEARLNQGIPARAVALTEQEAAAVRDLNLLSAKPILYAANVSEEHLARGCEYSSRVESIAAAERSMVVRVSAAVECSLAEMGEADRAEYLAALGVTDGGSAKLARGCYELLELRAFFTVGPAETRAWTIRAGDRAPTAASKIHSDFEKAFIRAETISFDDYVRYGSEKVARDAGACRSEGKEYVVQDGDVILFRTGR